MKGDRYQVGNFRYNGRVAVCLLPSLVIVASLGGASLAIALMAGAMVAYTFDVARQKEATLVAVWATMAIANIVYVMQAVIKMKW